MSKITVQVFKHLDGLIYHLEKGSESATNHMGYIGWTLISEYDLECAVPKKRVKKTVEGWAVVYPTSVSEFFNFESMAKAYAEKQKATYTRVSGEYEVEE